MHTVHNFKLMLQHAACFNECWLVHFLNCPHFKLKKFKKRLPACRYISFSETK